MSFCDEESVDVEPEVDEESVDVEPEVDEESVDVSELELELVLLD